MSKTQTQTKTQRVAISQEEYAKKVTIAMAHYEYFGYMSRAEATRKAQQEVSQEYVVKS